MTIEEKIQQMDQQLFAFLIENNCAEEFAMHMKNRAEVIARTIPGCQNDRQAAVFSGMIAICYKLADEALVAQSEYEMKAKIEEAERIRRELAGE